MKRCLLMGCALGCGSPTWTDRQVMQPHLTVLDADQDGVVNSQEYTRHRWNGPPFATIDSNGNHRLDPEELAQLVRGQSATRFDGTKQSTTKAASGTGTPRTRAVQHTVETLLWQHTALVAAGQDGLSPALKAAVEVATSADDPALQTAATALVEPWATLTR